MKNVIFRAKSTRAPFRRAGFLFSTTRDWHSIEFTEGDDVGQKLAALVTDPAITVEVSRDDGALWHAIDLEPVENIAALIIDAIKSAAPEAALAAKGDDSVDEAKSEVGDVSPPPPITERAETGEGQEQPAQTAEAVADAIIDPPPPPTQSPQSPEEKAPEEPDAEAADAATKDKSGADTEQSSPKTRKKGRADQVHD